jgi:hypothetical protein
MGILDWLRSKKQKTGSVLGNVHGVSRQEEPKSQSTTSSDKLQWQELRRDDFGFTISYPQDWFVEYTSQGVEIRPHNLPTYFDTELGRDVASPGVNISIAELPRQVNDAVRQFKAVRPRGYKGYKQIKEYPCHLAVGTDAQIYEFQYNAGRIGATGLSLLVQKGNKMFNVTASAKREDFEESRDMIFRIISGFKLL